MLIPLDEYSFSLDAFLFWQIGWILLEAVQKFLFGKEKKWISDFVFISVTIVIPSSFTCTREALMASWTRIFTYLLSERDFLRKKIKILVLHFSTKSAFRAHQMTRIKNLHCVQYLYFYSPSLNDTVPSIRGKNRYTISCTEREIWFYRATLCMCPSEIWHRTAVAGIAPRRPADGDHLEATLLQV